VHEVFAGLVPVAPHEVAQRESISSVQIARVERRALPTPTPSPPPPPRVVSHAHVIAPVETHVVRHTVSGVSAHKEVLHRAGAARPKPPVVSHAKPIWDIPVGAQGAGAGNKSDAGSLGNGGKGTGVGANGNGSGAAAGNEPCGFVDFTSIHGSQYDRLTHRYWVDIRVSVHFADGHSESAVLDYPWWYPNAAVNPFSEQNLSNNELTASFQFPPSDKRASEPPLVQYVMAHTDANGVTLLKDCPAVPSNPGV
jgi:hypothetical protein